MGTSRQDSAESEFYLVLAADPRCGAAHYYLAEIYRRRGELTAAQQQLQKAVLAATKGLEIAAAKALPMPAYA